MSTLHRADPIAAPRSRWWPLGGRQRTVIAPDWKELLHAEGLTTVAGVYGLTAGQVFIRTGSTEVRRVELGSGPGLRTVFIKKYWIGRTAQLWSGMFRGTFLGTPKARREYENLLRLRQWELDAPAPVAYGEERSAGWLMRSFLISEAVPDPMPLHVFIRDRLPSLPAAESAQARAKMLERLADATRRLHERRFVHHDYFWRNILLAHASTEHFFLIDAHKGRSWYPGESRRARACDLAALDAPALRFFRQTERLRFFLRYCGRPRLDRPSKRLLRLVLRLAAPMREKQLRRAMGANRAG